MIMPVNQVCPSCGKAFMGSDYLGEVCSQCEGMVESPYVFVGSEEDHPSDLAFNGKDGELGRLYFKSNGIIDFSGNASQAARMFFDQVVKLNNEHMMKLTAEVNNLKTQLDSRKGRDGDLVFSADGELFDDCFDTVCDALEYGKHDGEAVSIFVAELSERTHEDYFDMDYFVEYMYDRAYEDVTEFSEGYLQDVPPRKWDELEHLIMDWFNKNIEQPTFYGVRNVREIKYMTGQRDSVDLTKV